MLGARHRPGALGGLAAAAAGVVLLPPVAGVPVTTATVLLYPLVVLGGYWCGYLTLALGAGGVAFGALVGARTGMWGVSSGSLAPFWGAHVAALLGVGALSAWCAALLRQETEALAPRARLQSMVHRLDEAISTGTPLEEVENQIARELTGMYGARACLIWEAQPGRHSLTLLGQDGLKPQEARAVRALDLSLEDVVESIATVRRRRGAPGRSRRHPTGAAEILRRLLGIRAALVATVPVDERAAGVLALVFSKGAERHLGPSAAETLQAVADQLGALLERHLLVRRLLEANEQTLAALAQAVEMRDASLGNHCQRLAERAEVMGMMLAANQRERRAIRYAALMHDVGKIGVPEMVLLKPGALTEWEREQMREHVRLGMEIISRIDALAEVAPLVYHHHERWDGQGYPDGLGGEQIPLGARILAVVDAYDALTNSRPYREPLEPEQALRVIEAEAGKQFDPSVVALLRAIVDSETARRGSGNGNGGGNGNGYGKQPHDDSLIPGRKATRRF